MNREDIIRMAKEAGFEVLLPSEEVFGRGGVYTGSDDEISKYLERFAALVASAEREACVEIAEKQRYAMNISLTSHPVQNGTAVGIANAIRARGQA